MKYSIIIPTLNEEKLLPGLLGSLSNQSLKSKFDYEVVVSDNGSTDGTLGIAHRLSDKVVCHEEGKIKSIAACRSNGAKCSSGSFLIFVNADVRFDVEQLLSTIEKKFAPSEYVAMTCPIKVLPDQEELRDKCFSVVCNTYYYFSNLVGLGIARGECQIIRRNVYETVGGYNEKIVAGEDFELFMRIRKHGKVLFSWSATVYESPRRYHKWGYVRTISAWLLTSAGSWFRKKPFYKEWETIR
jgi:glycosyltransferase involved in cell wall biosynthesis